MKKIILAIIITGGVYSSGNCQTAITVKPAAKVDQKMKMEQNTFEQRLKAAGVAESRIKQLAAMQAKLDEKRAKIEAEKLSDEDRKNNIERLEEENQNTLRSELGEETYRKYLEAGEKQLSVPRETMQPRAQARGAKQSSKKAHN